MHLNIDIAQGFKSRSQMARLITENWVEHNIFCPICGAPVLQHYKPNKPVADFHCNNCNADYELKSKESEYDFGNKITDGAYSTMIERINSLNNPHLFAMTHIEHNVRNLIFIPNFLFTPSIIEKRKPLSPSARRAGWAGWTGCNIIISNIPEKGKIYIVKNGIEGDKQNIFEQYKEAKKLYSNNIVNRSWLFDVLRCIERIPNEVFSLEEIYNLIPELQRLHPNNNNIHAKIRQQLQILRDKDFLEFIGSGIYKKK